MDKEQLEQMLNNATKEIKSAPKPGGVGRCYTTEEYLVVLLYEIEEHVVTILAKGDTADDIAEMTEFLRTWLTAAMSSMPRIGSLVEQIRDGRRPTSQISTEQTASEG